MSESGKEPTTTGLDEWWGGSDRNVRRTIREGRKTVEAERQLKEAEERDTKEESKGRKRKCESGQKEGVGE